MQQPNKIFVWLSLVFAFTAFSGCGDTAGNRTAVSGSVLFDGKPLTTGSVLTLPENGPGAKGVIDNEGKFSLATNGEPGASPGRHQVGVVALEATAGINPEAPRKYLIPYKYASPETSGLFIDVTPGDSNEVVLELSSAGD